MARMAAENSDLARRVRLLSRRGALPHAVILSGGGDRLAAARYLAAAMVCRSEGDRPCLRCTACRKAAEDIHPDIRLVQEEGRKELAVETVRQLRQDVYIRPNESERKVYVFADSAQLNERDQNVLLKIVEEGPPYAAFIFCAESAAALLPTVRSRCVELKLRQEEAQGAGSEDAAALCRAFAGGEVLPVAELLTAWENRRMKREQLQQLLEDAWRVCAGALLAQSGSPEQPCEEAALLSRSLSRARLGRLTDCLADLAGQCRYNVGPAHVLGALAARWEELLR